MHGLFLHPGLLPRQHQIQTYRSTGLHGLYSPKSVNGPSLTVRGLAAAAALTDTYFLVFVFEQESTMKLRQIIWSKVQKNKNIPEDLEAT